MCERRVAEPEAWPGLWFEFNPWPWIICEPELKIISKNRAGAALLARCAEIAADDQALRFADEDLTTKLREFVQRLCRQGDGVTDTTLIGSLIVFAMSLGDGVNRIALSLRSLQEEPPFDCAGLGPRFGVTPTELKIVKLLLAGLNATEIAERSNNSVLTIRTHVKRIYAKLGVSSREQLFARILPHLVVF